MQSKGQDAIDICSDSDCGFISLEVVDPIRGKGNKSAEENNFKARADEPTMDDNFSLRQLALLLNRIIVQLEYGIHMPAQLNGYMNE